MFKDSFGNAYDWNDPEVQERFELVEEFDRSKASRLLDLASGYPLDMRGWYAGSLLYLKRRKAA